jgi:hypothetical protein
MHKTKTYKKERVLCLLNSFQGWIQGVPQGGMVKPKGSRISLSYGAVSFVFHLRMGTKGSPRGMG